MPAIGALYYRAPHVLPMHKQTFNLCHEYAYAYVRETLKKWGISLRLIRIGICPGFPNILNLPLFCASLYNWVPLQTIFRCSGVKTLSGLVPRSRVKCRNGEKWVYEHLV